MDDYRAYPKLSEAARMLAVSTAALSRRKPEGVRFGGRELRLSPEEVMAQAGYFKRRPLSAVAGDLVRHTHERAPELVDIVDESMGRILAARPRPALLTGDEFLAEAQRVLPRRLYARVERFYRESSSAPPSLRSADDAGPARSRARRNAVPATTRASVGRVPAGSRT
jgi:hypothetical protein